LCFLEIKPQYQTDSNDYPEIGKKHRGYAEPDTTENEYSERQEFRTGIDADVTEVSMHGKL